MALDLQITLMLLISAGGENHSTQSASVVDGAAPYASVTLLSNSTVKVMARVHNGMDGIFGFDGSDAADA